MSKELNEHIENLVKANLVDPYEDELFLVESELSSCEDAERYNYLMRRCTELRDVN